MGCLEMILESQKGLGLRTKSCKVHVADTSKHVDCLVFIFRAVTSGEEIKNSVSHGVSLPVCSTHGTQLTLALAT